MSSVSNISISHAINAKGMTGMTKLDIVRKPCLDLALVQHLKNCVSQQFELPTIETDTRVWPSNRILNGTTNSAGDTSVRLPSHQHELQQHAMPPDEATVEGKKHVCVLESQSQARLASTF